MLFGMNDNAGAPAVTVVSPTLDIYRFYSVSETAAIFSATVEALDGWVCSGFICPVFLDGEPMFSGFAIAKLLGWPMSDDPRDYLPEQNLE